VEVLNCKGSMGRVVFSVLGGRGQWCQWGNGG
jgi:hypothetical protein